MSDAAIEILGESGDKGLSHVKVDRRAGVPDGSTSFYFRTRSALLHAVAERLTERDHDILLALVEQRRNGDGTPPQRGSSALATRLAAMAREPFRTQVKARYELFMLATRDPAMAELFQKNIDLENELLRDFVVRLQPAGADLHDAVIDDQTRAATALIGGITLTLVGGDESFSSPEKIDRFLLAVVTGIRDTPEVIPKGQRTPPRQAPSPATPPPQDGPMDRRRVLCDAAIEILGGSGLKGLSHLKVDRRAGVPDGTTSVHFRTRSALVHAAADRLTERSRDGSLNIVDPPRPHPLVDGPSALATELAKAATEPFRTQVKARYELFMLATRDAEMAAVFQRDIGFELEFLREVVRQLQPPGAADDALVADQALAVAALISGITLTLVAGDPSFRSPETIDRFLMAAATGMRSAPK